MSGQPPELAMQKADNLFVDLSCESDRDTQTLILAHALEAVREAADKAATERERERNNDAMETLSALALYLGVGSGDEATTADQFHKRILKGFELSTQSAMELATERERERCKKRLRSAYDAGVLSWDIFEGIMRDIHSGADIAAAIRKGGE